MFAPPGSSPQEGISLPGSVVNVRPVDRNSKLTRSPSPDPETTPPLFYPTPVPLPASPPSTGHQSYGGSRQVRPPAGVPSPVSSFHSAPSVTQSPPPSVMSYLDLSLSSTNSSQTHDSESYPARSRLESQLTSDVNVAVLSPGSSALEGNRNGVISPISERTLNGEAVLPCTPPFVPLIANLAIMSRHRSSFSNSLEGNDHSPAKINGFPSIGRTSVNGPAFIRVPTSSSLHQHPQNGWIQRQTSVDFMTTRNGLAQVEDTDHFGHLESNGSIFLQDVRSDAGTLVSMPYFGTTNGYINHPPLKMHHQSSTTSDPDAMGVGVVSVSTSRADLVNTDDDDEENGKCGWLCFRPKILQQTRTAKWVLFWLCWAAAAQGMVVNGFVNVCITTIEKRFDLRSTDTGLIAGAYDIASVLCSVPISYLGSRPGSSKPRWLGLGVFVMGVGSFFFAIPHFASPTYDPSGSDSMASVFMCLREGERTSKCGVTIENWLSSFRHIFVLGQFLHGVGASPLYTLGITYLDESVPVKMSSMYLGIFYAMAVIGPALGYLLGGQFLKIFIDAPSVDPGLYDLHPESDLWLGGWWIGFLVSGTLSMLISWPIMAFPSQLPGSKAIKSERVSEAHGSDMTSRSGGGFERLRDLPMAVKVLAFNPTFVTLSLAGATEGILLAGFATFMPKFLENQFSMPASFAALLVGFIVVPAGGGGTFLGGWLVKRFQLRCSGILKMCIIFSFLCLLSCLTFVISCPNIDFAGVSVGYQNRSITPITPNLQSSCNAGCSCDDVPYDPICGTNNIMYFSPCHAGCSGSEKGQDGLKIFTGCECVGPVPLKNSNLYDPTNGSPTGAPLGDPRLAPDSALREKCPTACSLMPIFLVIFFLVMTLTFIISLPALSGTLRCVPDTHRSFALGLQWIAVRLLGTIPGPILFGALIDNTCTLWQTTCGLEGSCRSYDNFYMSRYLMGISIIAKSLSTILFFLAWYLYVPPKSNPEDSQTSGMASSSGPPVSPVSKDSREMQELRGIDNPAADLS